MSGVFEYSTALQISYVGVSVLSALWIHELGHWLTGKIGGSDPKIHTKFYVIPYRVKHHNIDDFSSPLIRVSGLTPLAWWPLFYIFSWLAVVSYHPVWGIGSLSMLGAAASMSEGDGIAVRNPDQFRILDKRDEVPNENLYVSIAFRGWLSNN